MPQLLEMIGNMKKMLFSFVFCVALAACVSHPGAMDEAGAVSQSESHWFPSVQSDNLWNALRDNLNLDHYADHPEVQAQIDWYMKHPDYLERIFTRAKPYLYYIYAQTQKRHLPAEFALLPIVESAYDPFVYSNVGAAGLWQIMPGTASGYGITQNTWYDGRRDIIHSTQAALDYLDYLQTFFDGNWMLAIAAYDSGEGKVLSVMEHNKAKGLSTDFWSLPLPQETQAYVPKLLAIACIIAHPDEYGITLPYIDNAPYFSTVEVDKQIDLNQVAKLSHTSLETIYALNPGFTRWVTPPGVATDVLVPSLSEQTFETNYQKISKPRLLSTRRHVVQSGDNLIKLAKHYGVSVQKICAANHLKTSAVLHIGQVIHIPMTEQIMQTAASQHHLYAFDTKRTSGGPKRVVHTVRTGESVKFLAYHYRLKPTEIRWWNHLDVNQVLRPGMKLTIWLRHPENVRPWQQYTTYTVKSGDNLIAIAHRYHMTGYALWHENQLKSKWIHPGDKLKIPLLSHRAANTYRKISGSRPHPSHMYYEVKPGESISTIAERFDTTTRTMMRLNHLQSSVIRVGQRLRVPVDTDGMQHVKAYKKAHSATRTKTTSSKKTWFHYAIQNGDSLDKIAARFDTTVSDIAHWNAMKASELLKPGETLAIYAASSSAQQSRAKTHVTHAIKSPHYTSAPAKKSAAKKVAMKKTSGRSAHKVQTVQKHQVVHRSSEHSKKYTEKSAHTAKAAVSGWARYRKNPWQHYTIRSGDTLKSIAAHFHTTAEKLAHWNAMKLTDMLKPGETLAVYQKAA